MNKSYTFHNYTSDATINFSFTTVTVLCFTTLLAQNTLLTVHSAAHTHIHYNIAYTKSRAQNTISQPQEALLD